MSTRSSLRLHLRLFVLARIGPGCLRARRYSQGRVTLFSMTESGLRLVLMPSRFAWACRRSCPARGLMGLYTQIYSRPTTYLARARCGLLILKIASGVTLLSIWRLRFLNLPVAQVGRPCA